ncbi:MAG: TIGR02147 family protein [Bdellovibrionaceae bacterium]|nr:TIGR02147 family protein [Pseudobdellovibrionaceae bacterium]
MDAEKEKLQTSAEFLKSRLQNLKLERPHFSIRNECLKLRKVSPTLVSLLLQGKRKVTLDRVDELSLLLKLSPSEKQAFRNLVESEMPQSKDPQKKISSEKTLLKEVRKRNEVSDSILNNFLNIYVKDAFQIKELQDNPELIYKKLAFLADEKSIRKSIHFLLREGYLRKTLDSKIVLDHPLSVKEPKEAHLLVRRFHKKALKLATVGLDLVPIDKRLANTFIVPLDKNTYFELQDIIRSFTDQIKQFCEERALSGENLYQLNINLTPTGDLK